MIGRGGDRVMRKSGDQEIRVSEDQGIGRNGDGETR
jgi:hypothetical protein